MKEKTYKFTIKINEEAPNDKSKIPDFGLGVGVFEIAELTWEISDEDEKSPSFINNLLNIKDEYLNKWLKVEVEKIEN